MLKVSKGTWGLTRKTIKRFRSEFRPVQWPYPKAAFYLLRFIRWSRMWKQVPVANCLHWLRVTRASNPLLDVPEIDGRQ